jgi:hypothetical protein
VSGIWCRGTWGTFGNLFPALTTCWSVRTGAQTSGAHPPQDVQRQGKTFPTFPHVPRMEHPSIGLGSSWLASAIPRGRSVVTDAAYRGASALPNVNELGWLRPHRPHHPSRPDRAASRHPDRMGWGRKRNGGDARQGPSTPLRSRLVGARRGVGTVGTQTAPIGSRAPTCGSHPAAVGLCGKLQPVMPMSLGHTRPIYTLARTHTWGQVGL